MKKLLLVLVPFLAFAAERVTPQAKVVPSVVAKSGLVEAQRAPVFSFAWECVGNCGGTGGWKENTTNTVVTDGKNDLLNKYFKGSAYTAAWYMLLKNTGTISATDTLASHSGWTEQTPYSGNRPQITFGTTSAGSNTATAVSYSINATNTDLKGACVASVNTGTSGILYSCTDFTSARSVVSGDTLNVTLTVTD